MAVIGIRDDDNTIKEKIKAIQKYYKKEKHQRMSQASVAGMAIGTLYDTLPKEYKKEKSA